jgi:hypothetical protein
MSIIKVKNQVEILDRQFLLVIKATEGVDGI